MADASGNPTPPVDPGKQGAANTQALEHLQAAIENLQKALTQHATGTPGPSASGAIFSSGANVPPLEAQRIQQELQNNQPEPGVNPYASVAQISPWQAYKGARGAKKRGENWLQGALNQRLPTPGTNASHGPDASGPQSQRWMQGFDKGGSGANASTPPDFRTSRTSDIPGMSEEEAAKIQEESFEIPWFGEWQLDTKLRMARDWTGKAARGSFAGTKIGTALGGVSAAANYGYAHAAQIQVAKTFAQKAVGYTEGLSNAGASLGYSPESGIGGPSSIFGVRNPLSYITSEAGKQGAGMNWDAFKMSRMGTGLTMSQAREVYGSLAGMGFSNQHSGFLGMTTGGDLQNVATGFLGPLVREGLSPGVGAQFSESLKTGQVSIKALSESIKGLAGNAKETRQTMDQMAESVLNYATTAVGSGATPLQGYYAAKSFSTVTGQNPAIAGSLLGNQMFQYSAMANYHVLPENIGSLPGPQIAELESKLIKERMRTFSGVQAVRDSSGKEIVSAHKQQMSSVANALGIPLTAVEQMLQRGGSIAQGAKIAQEVTYPEGSWNTAWGHMEGKAKTHVMEKKLHDIETEIRQGAAIRGKHPGRAGHSDPHSAIARVREEFQNSEGRFSRSGWHAPLSGHDEKILREGGEFEGHQVTGSNTIEKWLKDYKVGKNKATKAELDEYRHAASWDKAKVAERIAQRLGTPNANGSSTSVNGVTIGLSPQAQKLFRIHEDSGSSSAQRAANAGQTPLTNSAASPVTPEGSSSIFSSPGVTPGTPIGE